MEDNFEVNSSEQDWERPHSLFGQPKDWLDKNMVEILPHPCDKQIQTSTLLLEDSTNGLLNQISSNEQFQIAQNYINQSENYEQESDSSDSNSVKEINEEEPSRQNSSSQDDGEFICESSLEEDKSNYNEDIPRRKRKNHRWGYIKDVQLFKHLRSLEKERKLDLSEILSCKNGHQLENKAFKQLCKKLNWRSTPFKLVERIRSIMDLPFSVREQNTIKNLVKKFKYSNINHEMILEKMRGKSLEVIQRACDIICKSRWNRNLNTLDINQELNNF